ncbi:Uma2 family endonuclease [Gloeobacter kilaueensis]|uniref:Putative restriction endonuclease domain-containing protein n=1 Tax=Gloeobacter kilaueensis (strain ATCC BAA-2537 / CCAP 1431/1 / ULC 316 / JS1) TaxID=1183438 RepID=U5QP16_GLOK1|nr:Uma2 family endonuclease [Gloeobacter kilaueensis]AGY60691.1 hypothetical protein GKIL_4445 [Gloeobacter kilaueensis JS1]
MVLSQNIAYRNGFKQTQAISVNGVGWNAYRNIISELPEGRSVRVDYYRGTLTLMSPSRKHEKANSLLTRLIIAICDELKLDVESLGSTLWQSQAADSAIEPDSSFYIQNEQVVRDKETLNLDSDPPPDLAVEVDITNPSLRKLPIYAALKIPEVWIYDGRVLRIFHLQQGAYVEAQTSLAFAAIPVRRLPEFLELGQSEGMSAAVAATRRWVQQLLAGGA